MAREVIINNTTFIVNSFFRANATEKLEQLLKRVIVSNAEKEFKKGSLFYADAGGNNRRTA
jgi:hypothetical protein